MGGQWKDIKLIVSDFDGVMTDNRVWIDETGKEMVCVSRADGQAVHILRALGIELVIMSTETNGVVAKRAEKMHVECIQSISDKAAQLQSYSDKRKIPLKNIAYIGNDINDYEALKLAGMKIVPHDAYDVVKEMADCITEASGGYGVIREVAEKIKLGRESE
jgi:YrbI family 3-deoxy-D-manno-octulosonate 8-phosphate phosphatase